MMRRVIAMVVLSVFAVSAVAQPAPWYWWTSKTTGKRVCAQTMQGEWERGSVAYKDARCEHPK